MGATDPVQTTLERPGSVLRHLFDVDDYHRMAEAGILEPGVASS